VLLIDVAGLSYGLAAREDLAPGINRLGKKGLVLPVRPSFPAVTCTVQAGMTTGATPSYHGIVSDGYYDRQRLQVNFREGSDRLVEAQRVWEVAREQNPDFTSAMLFWQNSVGSANDIILTPRRIRRHIGGTIQSCYARPKELYEVVADKIGPLRQSWFWGPFASRKSSAWTVRCAKVVLEDHLPNLVMAAVPSLAYCLQRHGPGAGSVSDELRFVDGCLEELLDAAAKHGYVTLVVGNCAIDRVDQAVFLNRILREHELLQTQSVRGMDYLDYGQSLAFAMVDRQAAHVFCAPQVIAEVYMILSTVPGIERILTLDRQAEFGIDHPRSGEFVLMAAKGFWFAYPWWHDPEQRPEFATHVAPESKPGHDPLELFWEGLPFRTAQNPARLRGSHGRLPDDRDSHGVLLTDFPATARKGELKDTDIFGLVLEALGLSPVEPSLRV
jgi:predicted AlkP superfamily pyrophosphatase or phosphodiesterase